MRANTHTGKQANTHTDTHWSGANKVLTSDVVPLLCTHLLVSLCLRSLRACVCVRLRVRSCVQCMPKCWLTFKTWAAACLQNNSFLLLCTTNIYISSCECTLYICAYVCMILIVTNRKLSFRSCLLYLLIARKHSEVSLSACIFTICVCGYYVCVRMCVWVHVCTLLTHEAIILVEYFWTFLLLVLLFHVSIANAISKFIALTFSAFRSVVLSFIFIFRFILCTEEY